VALLLTVAACSGGIELAGDGDDGAGDGMDDDHGLPPDGGDGDSVDACVAAPAVPRLLGPPNGTTTGSVHAPDSALVRQPLLSWLPAGDACAGVRYEVEIDDSCPTPAGSDCSFPSPEARGTDLGEPSWRPSRPLPVELLPPVGRRYFWRVRACDAGDCSAWSRERYIDVGRLSDDLNGDGYSDLVVGHEWWWGLGDLYGAVWMFPGSPAGISSVGAVRVTDPTGELAIVGARVAWAGDLNADGFADLLVRITGGFPHPPEPPPAAGVLVFLGAAAGLSAHADLRLSDDLGGPLFGEQFSSAGDTDADGFADVVVQSEACPDIGIATACLYLYTGSSAGLDIAGRRLVRPPAAGGAVRPYIPTAADFDRDGFSDVAASAGEGTSGGFVIAFRGVRDGLGDWADWRADEVGWLSAGDLDGDTAPDLVAADPWANEDQGQVVVRWLDSRGLPSAGRAVLTDPTRWEPRFGHSVALGDVTGDRRTELVVGSPSGSLDAGPADAGRVMIFGELRAADGSLPLLTLAPTTAAADAQFGASVAIKADADGDGASDLAVGAPTVGEDGAVFVFHGPLDHPAPAPETQIEGSDGWGYNSGFGLLVI
jgi:hypothetical protein